MAANWWHLTPEGLRQKPVGERTEMVATYLVNRQIEGYYNSEQLKRMDRIKAEAEAREKPGGMRLAGGG